MELKDSFLVSFTYFPLNFISKFQSVALKGLETLNLLVISVRQFLFIPRSLQYTFSAISTIEVFRSAQASLPIRQQIPGRNDVMVFTDSSHGLTSSSNVFPKESLKKKAFYKISPGILSQTL